jgi:NADH:ubiquinone oxidoreductase subunit E
MADLHPDNPYAKDRFADPQKNVQFPPEAQARFDHLLTRYPNKEAALLPTLHLAQEVWGWISPEVVHYVGRLLDLAPPSSASSRSTTCTTRSRSAGTTCRSARI